jgi:diphosphoinositol-polyphosphate diphosphatase
MPKGGWESDETCIDAAQREAWEEAGISCKIDYDLGTIKETRTPKQMSKDAPKALYQFFEVTVTTEHEDWPERHKRNRQWATYAEAEQALDGRPELLEALKRSTISR